jgi:HSP20 family molecular chaperone IbpA
LGVQAVTGASFETLLRIAKSSIAEPAWFATPVDAMEDAASITVVFHVPAFQHTDVTLTLHERSLTLQGPRRRGRSGPTRVCAFSSAITAQGIEVRRAGDLLKVRIPKNEAPSRP